MLAATIVGSTASAGTVIFFGFQSNSCHMFVGVVSVVVGRGGSSSECSGGGGGEGSDKQVQ